MGIENVGGKTPESSFEKRVRLNQEVTKLRAHLETVENGTSSGKAELANIILLEIAQKEKELAVLDGAPSKNTSPLSGGPTLTKYQELEKNKWGTSNQAPTGRGGPKHEGGQMHAPF